MGWLPRCVSGVVVSVMSRDLAGVHCLRSSRFRESGKSVHALFVFAFHGGGFFWISNAYERFVQILFVLWEFYLGIGSCGKYTVFLTTRTANATYFA